MGSLSRNQRLTLLAAALGTAAAGVATYAGAPDVLTFAVAGLALAALASSSPSPRSRSAPASGPR